jgi:opacity protein-like surface antigen
MRKIVAAAVAVLLCFTSFAQTAKQKAAFGFKAGVNVSTFRTAVEYETFDPGLKAGFAIGAFVDVPVSRKFAVQPEFIYSQMGAKAFDNAFGDKTFRLNYFSIPVLVKFRACRNFNVIAGPQMDFLIRGSEEDADDHVTTITNDIKDFDFAVTAGFEFILSKNITAGARYIHGTQDISTTANDNTLFNQGVHFSFAWKLLKTTKKVKAK